MGDSERLAAEFERGPGGLRGAPGARRAPGRAARLLAPPRALTTPAEWDALRARCDESVRRLAAAIRAADPARLGECRDTLQFVLHHDLYHAGQVGLLQRARP